MKRVVVIGASGFLGGAVVASLRTAGRAVVGVSRAAGPFVDRQCTLEELAGLLQSDDVVVNAAGVAIKDAPTDTALIRENLRVARAVAAACLAARASLLHVSSADIWPIEDRAGAVETAAVLPDTAYGLSKLAAERELVACTGLAYVVLRPTYVYGPGMFAGRVFASLVRQASTANIVLCGDADAATDYLHIDDFVRVATRLIDNDAWDGGIYHAASGTLTSLSHLAHTMIAAVGSQATVRFEDIVSGPRQRGPVSTGRLRALGVVPMVLLPEGCRSYARALSVTPMST